MLNALDESSSVTATVRQPDPPRAISSEEPECAWNDPEQPASDSGPRCQGAPTDSASANRVAILEQLSASIAEINQPISAVVMNAEAALRLLLARPTDTEAVRQLLACIVEDGMGAGNIIDRTRALINESAATEGLPGDQRCDPRGQSRSEREIAIAF